MAHRCAAARLQNMEETNEIGCHIILRGLQRIAHARLGSQMGHMQRFGLRKDLRDALLIRQIAFDEAEIGMLAQLREPVLFQPNIVIGIHIVETHDLATSLQQAARHMKADEAGRAGDEHRALFQAFNGVFAGHPIRPLAGPARGRCDCAR